LLASELGLSSARRSNVSVIKRKVEESQPGGAVPGIISGSFYSAGKI
jgi:hypothetical protein